MPAPEFTLPTTGTSPKIATRHGLEAGINAVSQALFDQIGAISTGLKPAGNWDASGGSFPSGAERGTYYVVNVAGTVDGAAFAIGDWLIPLVDAPVTGTYAGNWFRGDYSKVVPAKLDSAAAFEAGSDVSRGPGALWETKDGFRYEEVTAGEDLTNAAGVKLKAKADKGYWTLKQFGARGDGSDDTAAFVRLLNALLSAVDNRVPAQGAEPSWLVNKTIKGLIEPGHYRIAGGYDYPIGASQMLHLDGGGSQTTKIEITGDNYLFDWDVEPVGFVFRGIHLYGGKGMQRVSAISTSVGRMTVIEDNVFSEYSQCVYANSAQDNPGLKIRRNMFRGKLNADTIGLAITGLTAGTDIVENIFQRNRYHIKGAPAVLAGVDQGPLSTCNITRNDFFRWESPFTNTYDIWLVPNAEGPTNAGRGLVVNQNKFGNESIKSGDCRLLIADEGAGTGVWDKHHATTASTGWLAGVTWRDNNIGFKFSPTMTFGYSYTPNLRGFYFDDLYHGGAPTHIIQYDEAVVSGGLLSGQQTGTDSHYVSFARLLSGWANDALPPLSSNVPGSFIVHDPFGYAQESICAAADDWGGYVQLLTPASTAAFTSAGVASHAAKNNSLGGVNEAAAVRFQANRPDARFGGALTKASVTAGRMVNIEFELQRAASLPLKEVTFEIITGGSSVAFRRRLQVPTQAGWHKFSLKWMPRQNADDILARFVTDGYSSGVAEYLDIGRFRSYHGRAPSSGIVRSLQSSWAREHPIVGDYHLWVDATGDLRIKSSAPTSDTDGVVVGAQV
ncbi:hypothetical protein K3758_02620 [Sulfitobacter sp. W002]|uniref:hypothetical protein n=1 Tax=Sulfitobacter sp. W002 TaxID=2867024 RepID=UPI0021A822DC|nr:hypothetical protein [Sulfitobacter sp. W002]UWR30443.1 hypothetical protein K3758_02620 [Sulfitobacter sp. W002]